MTARSTPIPYAACAAILLSLPRASGQIPIQYIEGQVLLDGRPVTIKRRNFPGVTYHPVIKNGQVLETANGRVQAWRSVFLTYNSSLKMLSDHQAEVTIELRSGSAIIDTAAIRNPAVTVQYKDATIVFDKAGEYRIDADSDRLRVYYGEATVTTGVALQCTQTGGCWRTVGHSPAKTVPLYKGEQVGLNQDPYQRLKNTKRTRSSDGWRRA